MVSCVLVLPTGKSHGYTMIVEKLHMWWKTGVSCHHISTCDFDDGPPKHSSSSCLPCSTSDQTHVPQEVTYISK